jgi:hypothetical protein
VNKPNLTRAGIALANGSSSVGVGVATTVAALRNGRTMRVIDRMMKGWNTANFVSNDETIKVDQW